MKVSNILGFWLMMLPSASGHGHPVSRHLVTDDLSTVVVLADAETTQGPFDEEESDYVFDSDMTMPAIGGFDANQTNDRNAVLLGVPMTLTLTIYDITDGSRGSEMPGIEVFLWHCDALGAYSAVDSGMQCENTEGQKWLRAKQISDKDGQVVFNTIVPGWYGGRALHFHLRLRRPGDTVYSATSQIFVGDEFLPMLQNVYPYSLDAMPQTPLRTDNIFNSMSDEAQALLTPSFEGDFENGFEGFVSLGLQFVNGSAVTAGGTNGEEGGPGGGSGGPPPGGLNATGRPPRPEGGGPGNGDAGERCNQTVAGDELPAVDPDSTTSPGEAEYFGLASDDSEAGGCLAISDGTILEGTAIMLMDCDSSSAEKWRYDSTTGMFHSNLDDNFCLQMGHNGNGEEEPKRLRLYRCDETVVAQRLEWKDSSRIGAMESDECITFSGVNGNPGSDRIICADCALTQGQDHWSKV